MGKASKSNICNRSITTKMACIVKAGKMPKKGIQSIQKMEVHTHEYVSMLIIFGDHYILLLNPTIGIKVGRQ